MFTPESECKKALLCVLALSLAILVEGLTYLGHSASPVRACVRDVAVTPTFVPGVGDIAMRVPGPGRRRRLNAVHELRRTDESVQPPLGRVQTYSASRQVPTSHPRVDFSIASMEHLMSTTDLRGLTPSPKTCLLLTPLHAELLCQTSPRPQCNPSISELLHGLDAAPLTSRLFGASILEKLISRLAEWLGSDRLDRSLDWAEDVRVPPQEYPEILARIIEKNQREIADFVSSIAADGAVDGQKEHIKPSLFYMASGQQSFLARAREIVAAARSAGRATFQEALAGPWAYRSRLHSLGWDPGTERLHALRGRAPTSEKPACIAGAVLLALWAIPLFPSMSDGGRLQTIGLSRINKEWLFSWPVFSLPIDLAELTSIVQTRDWVSRDGRNLRPGIEAVYQSRRAEFGQGYAVFRPAQLTHWGSQQD